MSESRGNYPQVAGKSSASDGQFLVTEAREAASNVAVALVRISALMRD
jgi:hypothetical protein